MDTRRSTKTRDVHK